MSGVHPLQSLLHAINAGDSFAFGRAIRALEGRAMPSQDDLVRACTAIANESARDGHSIDRTGWPYRRLTEADKPPGTIPHHSAVHAWPLPSSDGTETRPDRR